MEAALAGRGEEGGVVTTEEGVDVCKGVAGDRATWAQVEVMQSIHKDTTPEMAMLY